MLDDQGELQDTLADKQVDCLKSIKFSRDYCFIFRFLTRLGLQTKHSAGPPMR